MAATFIDYNRQTEVGRMQTRALQLLREGRDLLTQVRAIHLEMRDGDGSDAGHYDQNVSNIGYQAGDYATANAAAKASFEELDSLHAKVTATTGDVTGIAISQAAARHGV